MRENLCEGALGIFTDNGARLGIQHPMDTCVLVTRSKPERLYNSQTEFVLGHAIVAGVQYGSQDRATQETDEQKVIEVTRLESGILPVVREAKELALFWGNAAVASVHPFQGGRNEKRRGRAAAFTGKPREFGAFPHAGMRLTKAARAETKLAWYEPKALPRCIVAPIRSHRDHLGHSALSVRPEPLDAIALLAPILGIAFDFTCEEIVGIAVARGGQIAGGISFLIVERRIIDVSWQKQNAFGILSLRDNVDLMSAIPAETGWIEAVARCTGVFELTFE